VVTHFLGGEMEEKTWENLEKPETTWENLGKPSTNT